MAHLMRVDTVGPREERLSPGGTVLGRLPNCDIVLEDRGVSRAHARVWRDAGQWYVKDLGSRAGVRVNGNAVTEHALGEGDRIDLGPVRFVFSEGNDIENSWSDANGDNIDIFLESAVADAPLIQTMVGQSLDQGPSALLSLVRSAERLRGCSSVESVADTILEVAQQATGAQRAVLVRFDRDGNELGVHLGAGPQVRPSRTFVARVLEAQVALLARDVNIDPDLAAAESIAAQAVLSLLCAPLWDGERVSGVLYMDRQRGRFSSAHLDLAVAFGHQAAAEIARLELLEQLVAEQERRRTLLRFLPPGVAAGLADDPDALAATERVVVVVCAGLTGLSGGAQDDVSELLDALVEVAVDEAGGTLLDAAPDNLKILFGAPTSEGPEADAGRAARAAVRLSKAVEALRGQRRPWATLRLRVGLHIASATVGLLGPARRREYRAVGPALDGAETAMRASLPGRVLASTAVWPHLAGTFQGVPRPGALVDGAPGWWVTAG